MLDLRQVGDHLDEVKTQLARRGYDDGATLDRLAALVSSRSQAIVELEECQRERNEAAQAMGKIADKSSAEFAERRESLKGLKERMKALETTRNEVEAELEDIVLGLPNLPHESTPDGKDESANVVVREWGEKPAMDFTPKDHVELGDVHRRRGQPRRRRRDDPHRDGHANERHGWLDDVAHDYDHGQ